MQKCATIWLQMKMTITEHSKTTSAQLDYKIQKERTLHLVLRMRGEVVTSALPLWTQALKINAILHRDRHDWLGETVWFYK